MLRPALGHLLLLALFITQTEVKAQRLEMPPGRAVQEARSELGMLVSDSAPASRVGRDVLSRGGNAVDAAVATAFALAVTWPEAGNIGGGGFMMIFPPDGRDPVCVDYRETAPLAATERMYQPNENRNNAKAVGVPGTPRGLELAHKTYGRLPWPQLVQPAVRLARNGFEVDGWLAYSINSVLRREGPDSELRRVYGRDDGRPWQAGDQLQLPELAATLQRIAQEGANAFYQGTIADQIVAEMRRDRGLIMHEDLASYRAKIRQPIHGTYRGYDLYGPPPPSSGGICVIEALNILEGFHLRERPRYGARNMHLITEAMRRAFCDRARYLGDPDFVAIPQHLTSKMYAEQLAEQISPRTATPSASLAPEIQLAQESLDTTHFSVMDRDGMAVSNTYTLEASWGARVVVRGAGFVLNNEMGDFNWVPEHTDTTGRIGTPPNLIQPGKRMLSSMSPFIVSRDGKVVLLTGTPGGRTIINTVLGNLLNVLEFNMPLGEAIDAPRMHHQWFPDELRFEGARDARYVAAVEELRALGHTVRGQNRQGSAHSITVDPQSGDYVGVADWRRGGRAIGVDAP